MKIETNINEKTFIELKEELKKKQIQFVSENFENEELKNMIKKLVTSFIERLLNKKLKFFVKNPNEIKNEINPSNFKKIFQSYLFKYSKIFFDFEKEYVNNYKVPVSELFTKKVIDKIEDAIDEPFDLDEKTIKDIIDQDAVKGLFVSLIYSAFEKFTKNLPFMGGIVSFENEIKKFISQGMNFTIDVATKFIVDKKNEKVIQGSIKKLFRMILSYELDLIVNKLEFKGLKGKEEEIFEDLISHILETEMIKEGLNYTIDQIYRIESNKTIKEMINDANSEQALIEYLSDRISILVYEFLNYEIMKKFLEKSISDFYDSLNL